MGRPRQHDDRTRATLLAAAEKLLAGGGAAALSVRAVAEGAGVSTRAVYSVFGSMDGLLQALLGHGFQDLVDRVIAVQVTADPAADLVRAGVDGFRRFAVGHPDVYRLGFERLVPGLADTAESGRVMHSALAALTARVARCADAGLLGGRDVRQVTWQFHAFCQGLASIELQGWMPASAEVRERMWVEALTAFVAGCSAPVRESAQATPGRRRR